MSKLINFIMQNKNHHYFNESASAEQIAECEEILKIILPPTYKTFLRYCNGALLYESDEIFGTHNYISGIGNLIDHKGYKIAEHLPTSYVLFHDDGFVCHIIDTVNKDNENENQIYQWDPKTQNLTRRFTNLADWTENYLQKKWNPDN